MTITLNGTTGITTPGFTNTGTETISSGTANGVAYLNGSKVLTTGSALVFDGTNLGIGTSSPGTPLDVYSASNGIIRVKGGSASNQGSAFFVASATSASTLSAFGDWARINGGAVDQATAVYSVSTAPLILAVGSERARIDTSGNLGLGVTPSAWGGALTGSMQFKSGGFAISSGSGIAYLTNNTYYNGTNWIYTASDYATRYLMVNGQHQWFTAASGIVGNAVTWTQGMALDALSNLSLSSGTTGNCFISFANTADGGTQGYVGDAKALIVSSSNSFLGVRGESGIAFGIGSSEKARIDSSGNLGIGVTPSAWTTFPPVLQIKTGSGSGSIAGTGPDNFRMMSNVYYDGSYKRYAAGYATMAEQSSGAFYWYNAGTSTAGSAITWSTPMTLDASGNLVVGQAATGAGERFGITGNLNNFLVRWSNQNATPYGLSLYYSNTPNNTGSQFIYLWDGTALRAEIRSNGGLANFQANNANLSDARLKTDVQDAGGYLAKICAIPVKTFLYKDQTDTERNLGVMAQDVDAVAPELVDHSGFGKPPEGESPYLAIYQTDLQYALMKCIQELKAELDALKGAN